MPSTSATPAKPTEGWWMRPCYHCGGKHMDSLCPTKRASAQATSTSAASPPKGAGKGAKGPGKGKPAINPNYYAGYCY
eukprot:8110406-Heterocapsa_arctica.AAC.1